MQEAPARQDVPRPQPRRGKGRRRARHRIPETLGSFRINADRTPGRRRPNTGPAVKSVRQYRENRERIVAEETRATRAGRMGPGAAPHGSSIEYCETTPKSLASRVSACISSRVAQTDDRSARRKFLRVLPDRYFRDLRVVAWNDNANHVSVLVRRFDDEGLRRFVGMAQECTHQIAASGTLAQFQL